MNNVSQILESKITDFAKSLYDLQSEAKDLDKYYFSSGVSALIAALPSDGSAATVSSGLSKSQFISGISLIEQFSNLINNRAISQADYLSSAQNLIGGSNVAGSALSNDAEAIGLRLKSFAQKVIALYQDAVNISKIYNVSLIGNALAGISGDMTMFGCSTTQNKFFLGISMVSQFSNLLGNLAVTQGDYYSSVVSWAMGI